MAENLPLIRTSPEKPHSIEVSRNAKGEYSFCVKVYFADGEEIQAKRIIDRVYTDLLHTYKMEK